MEKVLMMQGMWCRSGKLCRVLAMIGSRETPQDVQLIIDYIDDKWSGYVDGWREQEHVSSKPASYDQSKVHDALNSGKRIELPSGLSKEQKRQFILSSR